MPLPAWIAGILTPVTNLVDKLVTTQEERGQIRLALMEAQIGLTGQVLEYETKLAEYQSQVVTAEIKGESWMQRNWRPLIMLTFGFVIAWNFIVVDVATWIMAMASPGVAPPPRLTIPEGMWVLLNVGIGGYIASRGAEKIAGTLVDKGISFGKKDGD